MSSLSGSGLLSPGGTEAEQIKRRRKLAEMLMQQGTDTSAATPLQAVARMVQAYFGSQMGGQLDGQEKALAEQNMQAEKAKLASALQDYDKFSRGDPGLPLTPNDDDGNPMPAAPISADPRRANMSLVNSGIPMLQQQGLSRMLATPKEEEPFTLAPGAIRYGKDGKPIASAPFEPKVEKKEGPKEGQIRTRTQGTTEVQESFENGKWVEIGRGPRWQPPQAPAGEGKPAKAPIGYRYKPDGVTLEPIPGGPAATGRALPTKAMEDLGSKAEIVDTTTRLVSGFKEGFGNKTIMGELSNVMGRILGDDTGQAQWWQDYQLHQNQVRNKLFGSALTPTEAQQWERAAINPRMDSGEIRKNLQRREELERKGLERMMAGYSKGGYNVEQIEAVTGRPASGTKFKFLGAE